MSTPGEILPGGIVLIDEPAHVNVTTFASNGEVLDACLRAIAEGKGGTRFPDRAAP